MATRIELFDTESVTYARRVEDISDIRKLADWLDTRFVIPALGWRFGFDTIIGLIPGIGDLATTILGAYIVLRAKELGASPWLLTRMSFNLAIDAIVGAVPLFGDLFDMAFKSHAKNVALLMQHLEKTGRV